MSGTGTQTKSQTTFEFTKRKRWADILIAGLTDVIVFVLSPGGKTLYYGAAVTELLGWGETEILNLHLNDFIIGEDQALFQRSFEDSVRTNTELLVYVRLRCNPAMKLGPSSPNDMLFEIKGYPHFVSEPRPECKCFFAIAKPYPSRNVAALNTFLDLQMENERLQQRLAMLKARVDSEINLTGRTLPNASSMYATSSLRHDNQYSDTFSSSVNNAAGNGYVPTVVVGTHNGEPSNAQSPEDLEEGSRKKKFKKTGSGAEQYVCRKCGRTDSPEWRKGPDGPKTLCNACGLRWAKQMRKFDEPSEETSASPSHPTSSSATENNSNSNA